MDHEKCASSWSAKLAQAIVDSIPDELLGELRTAFDVPAAEANSSSGGFADIIERATTDIGLQRELNRAWRKCHPELINASQFASLDGSHEQSDGLVRCFGAEKVLLEIITDEHDDGWWLADWTVENVKNDELRGHLARILKDWSPHAEDRITSNLQGERKRIVIFGGHPRDESKMNPRLFEESHFDVRWKPYDKSFGSPNGKDVNEALAHSDVVILVTTRVSHNVMRLVKRSAREHRIPMRQIQKATSQQLRTVFAELFPNLPLPSDR